MHLIDSTRVEALASVVAKDYDDEYFLRKVFRWYSERFATPLHEVYNLDLEFIFQHYWEVQYESMNEHQREQERLVLMETEEQRWKRSIREDADRAEADTYAAKVASEEKTKVVKDAEEALKGLTKAITTAAVPRKFRKEPEAELPGSTALPEIKMEFISDEELERVIEQSSINPPAKP